MPPLLNTLVNSDDPQAFPNIVDIAIDQELLDDFVPLTSYQTDLYEACLGGQVETCRRLLAEGADATGPRDVWRYSKTPLSAAVENGHLEVIDLLLPHVDPCEDFLTLPLAISAGTHAAADRLIASGRFRYAGVDPSTIPSFNGKQMDHRVDVPRWHAFLLDLPTRAAGMDSLHLEYGLILGVRAGNAGMPLIRELVEKAGVSVNGRVRVDDTTLTPLTHAAEMHCYDNVYYLARCPSIDVSATGAHGWPAFLAVLNDKHVLECRNCENLLDFLWTDRLLNANDILRSSVLSLDNVLDHTLRLQTVKLTRRIVKLLAGVVGPKILPLLVIACDRDTIRWALSKDSFDSISTRLWILLCDHLHKHYDERMQDCFHDIAVMAQGWGKWSKPLVLSITSKNFAFAKHLFLPTTQQPDRKLVRETVKAYAMCSHNDELIHEWVYTGHANTTLWNRAVVGGFDMDTSSNREEDDTAQFATLLKDSRLNFNATPPARLPTPTVDHPFITTNRALPSYEEFSQMGIRHDRRRNYQALADRTLDESTANRELVREHLAKRRKIRQERWESLFKMPTLLLWAAEAGRRDLVLRLVESPGVDPNYQDIHGCTALIYAAARNDLDNVGVLLSSFEDLDVNKADRAGRTALMYAAQAGYQNVVIMLIGSGRCEPSLVDHTGHTAAAWAHRAGHSNVVQSIDHPNDMDIIVDGVDQDTNELAYWFVKSRELRGGPSRPVSEATSSSQTSSSGEASSSSQASSGGQTSSSSGAH